MRKKKLEEIDLIIKENRKSANETIFKSLPPKRRKRSRTRTLGEREALDKIAVARWKKAEAEGKIKRISKRKMYYDYR
ncbi:hypothetical protein [Gracilibacillus massiliensis]|uniref:hypothetical protein n=1 Tax=Gracilibacillus massiliensis TaxID=1564956 RepID=UPI00071D4B15|nr:hypothetical protein [Gracilibacillus massiliensis]